MLSRTRLTQRLLDALNHRLTLIQAGTGYGKTTALLTLTQQKYPVLWQQLEAEDSDPQRLLSYLLHGMEALNPNLSEAPRSLFEEWSQNRHAVSWSSVVDSLVNALAEVITGPALFILDDAHHLNKVAESIRILDRLIGHSPTNVHFIVSTRYPLQLPSLVTWQVKGSVLHIGQRELAFTGDEIEELFRECYDHVLTPSQADLLLHKSEGWAIALYLIWQQWQSDDVSTVPQALVEMSGTAGDLLDYLTQEVITQQPADVQEFLQETSVLRQMNASICDYLRDASDSAQILRYLIEVGLFVVRIGEGHVRYHHLFRDLLLNQRPFDYFRPLHLKAAAYYQQQGATEGAVYHFLAAEANEQAAIVLDSLGWEMVRSGRLDTLADWIASIPPDVLAEHPPLLTYLGDIARLHSRFDEALAWYKQAEEGSRRQGNIPGLGQALRGQARVYLDTVNPARADQLLQEAIRLVDGQESRESKARLLDLLAENLLNQGRSEEAERYQNQAQALRQEGPGEEEVPVRLLLRTGRLEQALDILEKRAAEERKEPVLRPRAHRETLLLLSIIYSFQGKKDAAYEAAVEGTERGQALDSQFITTVGYMRQGHAHLLDKDEAGFERATHSFQQAVTLSDTLFVPRLKVEAYWGLCQAFGFRGDLAAARQLADQAMEIARDAGDEWISAMVQTTLGASYLLAGSVEEATSWLSQASTTFAGCADSHGQAITRLWGCLAWKDSDNMARLERNLNELLELVNRHDYHYLFTRRTLLGPPDPRRLVPLLLVARDNGIQAEIAERLLNQLGLPGLKLHPGYQLRIQTFGAWNVWRGTQEIPARDWQRKSAQLLLQLLVTHRQQLLDRDQIAEFLWPGSDPEESQRNFKVALSTLMRVLEPERDRNVPSAFILRDGSMYSLRPEADLWIDAAAFDRLVAKGDKLRDEDEEAALMNYRQALDLFQGVYLHSIPYEDWCGEERERLQGLYLTTAERVVALLENRNLWEEAMEVCKSILRYDDCWEQAYRYLMIAYHHLGNRAQVVRTYQRCVKRLDQELGLAPTETTVQLYQSLI